MYLIGKVSHIGYTESGNMKLSIKSANGGKKTTFVRKTLFVPDMGGSMPNPSYTLLEEKLAEGKEELALLRLTNGSFRPRDSDEWVNAPDHVIAVVLKDATTMSEAELRTVEADLRQAHTETKGRLKELGN